MPQHARHHAVFGSAVAPTVLATVTKALAPRAATLPRMALDPRLTDALVEELVTGPCLHTLTKHFWRGKARALRLLPQAPDVGPVVERDCPARQ